MAVAILGGTFVASIAYVLYICIYRLYFHPLSKYPGPTACALTDWYCAYSSWTGDIAAEQGKWRRQYGDIVRSGPSSLTFFGQSASATIYHVRANVCKADGYRNMSVSHSPNLITAVDKETYGFKRRVISQTMTDQALRDCEERILTHIQEFVGYIGNASDVSGGPLVEEGWSPSKDMGIAADWLTFDVISDLLYGQDQALSLKRTPENRWLPGAFRSVSQLTGTCLFQPNLSHYKLDRLLLASRRKQLRDMGIWLSKLSRNRAESGISNDERDIFSTMMSSEDPKTGKKFTEKDLWVESVPLLAAGADTTSSTLSAAIFYLLHNPEWLVKTSDEVQATFSSEADIRMSPELSSCEILNACINETMRLTPTVPNGPPRYVQPGGITIDGHYIPEGIIVNSPIYHLQRDEAVFDSPNAFKPERWMVDPEKGYTEERIKQQHQSLIPFSTGPRSCVGWRLAMMELSITIGRLCHRYDMRLAPETMCCSKTPRGEKCEYRLWAWMVAAVEGPLIQSKRRAANAAV